MLPKELSNGKCSLNHGEDRYAISAIMKIDKKGNVIDTDVQKSVINVTKRLNYHEVYADIEDDENIFNNEFDEKRGKNQLKLLDEEKYDKIDEKFFKSIFYRDYIREQDKKYLKHFKLMEELALILKNRREKNGYLELDIPETKIVLDENKKPIKIMAYETNFANEIIEQFMLTANEQIAEKFYWLNAPFIYRNHESPDEEKVDELNKVLFNFGYNIRKSQDEIKPKSFELILKDIKGKSEERLISTLVLRTLKIAKYEDENKGHFGIASKCYCHFTSPIRRYPDLFIHRIISEYLKDNYNVSDKFIEKHKKQAKAYAESSSAREQIAQKVERESIKIKSCEYMEKNIGKVYNGFISSVTRFGIFVELENTVEGLIKYDDLGDDYYIYDEQNKIVIGEQTKEIYKIGDEIKIIVKYANKIEKFIDFAKFDTEKMIDEQK